MLRQRTHIVKRFDCPFLGVVGQRFSLPKLARLLGVSLPLMDEFPVFPPVGYGESRLASRLFPVDFPMNQAALNESR